MSGRYWSCVAQPEQITALGKEAYRTITEKWNAECAAQRCLEFYEGWKAGKLPEWEDGPLSAAPSFPRTGAIMREHGWRIKQNKNCLISVIVPVYNILDCLERCVNSICGQTWKNLEILLVDDGSTDGTGKLCDLLAEKDDRIRVFHKPNGGSSSARNLGISMAKGKWIGFVDSDDWIEPQMYEGCMKLRPLQALQLRRLRGMRSTRITTKDRTSVRRRNRKLPARQKIF